jgi:hypothetical protein
MIYFLAGSQGQCVTEDDYTSTPCLHSYHLICSTVFSAERCGERFRGSWRPVSEQACDFSLEAKNGISFNETLGTLPAKQCTDHLRRKTSSLGDSIAIKNYLFTVEATVSCEKCTRVTGRFFVVSSLFPDPVGNRGKCIKSSDHPLWETDWERSSCSPQDCELYKLQYAKSKSSVTCRRQVEAAVMASRRAQLSVLELDETRELSDGLSTPTSSPGTVTNSNPGSLIVV